MLQNESVIYSIDLITALFTSLETIKLFKIAVKDTNIRELFNSDAFEQLTVMVLLI